MFFTIHWYSLYFCCDLLKQPEVLKQHGSLSIVESLVGGHRNCPGLSCRWHQRCCWRCWSCWCCWSGWSCGSCWSCWSRSRLQHGRLWAAKCCFTMFPQSTRDCKDGYPNLCPLFVCPNLRSSRFFQCIKKLALQRSLKSLHVFVHRPVGWSAPWEAGGVPSGACKKWKMDMDGWSFSISFEDFQGRRWSILSSRPPDGSKNRCESFSADQDIWNERVTCKRLGPDLLKTYKDIWNSLVYGKHNLSLLGVDQKGLVLHVAMPSLRMLIHTFTSWGGQGAGTGAGATWHAVAIRTIWQEITDQMLSKHNQQDPRRPKYLHVDM